jgi:hypothetical protein
MSSTSQMQRIPHRIDEPAQQARVPFLRWTQRSDLDVPRIEQAVIARFLDDPPASTERRGRRRSLSRWSARV